MGKKKINMKEKIKYIIIFIAGILISVVISVSAATVITAGEVSYTSNSNTTVQTGLNNLYTKANTMANTVTALNTTTSGSATINTTNVTSGQVVWRKIGRVVVVSIYDIIPKAVKYDNQTTVIASGLPTAATWTSAIIVRNGTTYGSYRVGIDQNSTNLCFWWWTSGTANINHNGQLIYIAKS